MTDLVIKKGVAILIQPEYKENSYLLKMNLDGTNTDANAVDLTESQETSYNTVNKDIVTTDGNYNIINGQIVEPVTFNYGFYATYQKKSNMPAGAYYMLKDGSFKYAVNSLWTKGLRGFIVGDDEAGTTPAEAKISIEGFTTGIKDVVIDGQHFQPSNIYNTNGQLVRKNITSTEGLAKGIYIMNGKKVLIK